MKKCTAISLENYFVDTGAIRVKQSLIQIQLPNQDTPQIKYNFIKKLRYYARSDWPRDVFAWDCVNMVVTSRCFAFRVENSTSLLYLPIPSSAETKDDVQILLRLSWHFKREKSTVFWKASFLQNKNWIRVQDFVYKTSRLVRISLLISAITKSLTFLGGKLIYKSYRKPFFLYLYSLI